MSARGENQRINSARLWDSLMDMARFGAALRRELQFEAERVGRRRLASIFFGGGTPSLMPPATVAALISAAEAVTSTPSMVRA